MWKSSSIQKDIVVIAEKEDKKIFYFIADNKYKVKADKYDVQKFSGIRGWRSAVTH